MNSYEGIIKFNEDRNLRIFDLTAETDMLDSELTELKDATTTDEIVDALCDLVVLAVGGLHKLSYDPETAMQETLKEIMSRQGEFNAETGKWEKDPNQDPSSLYKANYDLARR